MLSSYLIAGCGSTYGPGSTLPCVNGFATFGSFASGAYGLRFDLRVDFAGRYADPFRTLRVDPDFTNDVRFSTRATAAECANSGYSGVIVGGRCQMTAYTLGASYGGGSALNGRTTTNILPGFAVGDPASFRLDGLAVTYEFTFGPPISNFGTENVRTAVTLTPEPTTLALAGAGVLLVGVWGRRQAA